MGRITVFVADGCSHCKRTISALEARKLPFTVINITQYPPKRADMMSLSRQMSTPQVFFNTRHVGGADATIALLHEWDLSCNAADRKGSCDVTVCSSGSHHSSGSKKSKGSKSSSSSGKLPVYESVSERYMAEIGKYHDPVDKRFEVPNYKPIVAEPSPPRVYSQEHCVDLPGGDTSTIVEMTEMLKDLIKHSDNTIGKITYKRSFHGLEVVTAARIVLSITDKEAVKFASQLLQLGIFHSVEDVNKFESRALYRMHCYSTPDILNSYRVWTENVDADSMRLLNRLTVMLQEIKMAVTDCNGLVNLKKAVALPQYPIFEEAICELQRVDLKGMNDRRKIVSTPYEQ
jgi:glutaredoxin